MHIERNYENLNIRFTSTEADNDSIYQASNTFFSKSPSEIAQCFDCDIDSAELIKNYLTDPQAMSEGLNVEFWFG